MGLKDKLKKFDKSFKTAKERAKEEGGFGNEYPDGKYKARLDSCQIGEAQSSGRLQVDFGFAIIAGEYKGAKVHKYQSVETEDDQVWLARDFRRFGIEAPENSDELVEIVKLLDDSKPELIISLKTKDSGQFCYIDKVTSDLDLGDLAAEETGEEEEEQTAEKEAEEGSEEGAEEDIAEGDAVSLTVKGEEAEGEVVEVVDEENLRVKVGKVIYRVKAEKVTKLNLAEGMEDGSAAEVEADSGEEEEAIVEEESAPDEVNIEIGMEIEFKGKDGKKLSGKVLKILEDEEAVKVKTAKGSILQVPVDKLSLPEKPAKMAKKLASSVKKHKR